MSWEAIKTEGLSKLVDDCNAWLGDSKEEQSCDAEWFSELVDTALIYIPEVECALVRELECIPSAIRRYAKGTASPHPGVKRIVIRFIRDVAKGTSVGT